MRFGLELRCAGLRRALLVVGALAASLVAAEARASFLDDADALAKAISTLRPALGAHPRILRIDIEANVVAIEAQDPRNPNHIDRWRCGEGILRVLPMRVSAPEPVDPALLDKDLDANLFDLDMVDFGAAARLERDAIVRAGLEGQARVTHMEIARQVAILPSPKAGEVRWTLAIGSGREHAEVFADAKGAIFGADLSGTQRARNLDLIKTPELVSDAASAFRAALGAGPVLTAVAIDAKSVSFVSNLPDKALGSILKGLPAREVFSWSLGGLARRIGSIDVSEQMGTALAPFGIDDVDWTVIRKLEAGALAKLALPGARVAKLRVERSSEGPGGPVLAWTVEIAAPQGDTISVVADLKGAISRVVLPERLRPKTNWLDPASLAAAFARIRETFGKEASIASIMADDRGCRVTIDDPASGGKPASFELSADNVSRAAITFSLDAMGPRFPAAELARLTQEKLADLEVRTLKTLGERRKVYLESVRIGSHPLALEAGGLSIEVRVRDAAQDSASANYAWMLFDIEGRLLDSVTY